jgi:hypothetical protein
MIGIAFLALLLTMFNQAVLLHRARVMAQLHRAEAERYRYELQQEHIRSAVLRQESREALEKTDALLENVSKRAAATGALPSQ